MSNDNLTIAFTVQQSPDEAFAAITSVRNWWSGEIEGSTDQHGAAFTYRYQDIHRSTQRITELVPARRIGMPSPAGTCDHVNEVQASPAIVIAAGAAGQPTATERAFPAHLLASDDHARAIEGDKGTRTGRPTRHPDGPSTTRRTREIPGQRPNISP